MSIEWVFLGSGGVEWWGIGEDGMGGVVGMVMGDGEGDVFNTSLSLTLDLSEFLLLLHVHPPVPPQSHSAPLNPPPLLPTPPSTTNPPFHNHFPYPKPAKTSQCKTYIRGKKCRFWIG